MAFLVSLAVLSAFLLLIYELLLRGGKWTGWVWFFVLPVILTPHWMRLNDNFALFQWGKLYTIVLSGCWITGLRFTRVGRFHRARFVAFALLVINMMEAIVQDSIGGHMAHYLTVIAGLLLIATLPNPLNAIEISESGHRELRYKGLTRSWVIEYTLWNAAFVYLNFPALTGQHCAALGCALVIGMVDPRRWLLARGYTLAADLLIFATFPTFLGQLMDTSHWSSAHREIVVASVCLGVISSCSIRLSFRHSRRRRNIRRTD